MSDEPITYKKYKEIEEEIAVNNISSGNVASYQKPIKFEKRKNEQK